VLEYRAMLMELLARGLALYGAVLPFSIAASSLIIFSLFGVWLLGARYTFRLGRPKFGPVELTFSLFLAISLLSSVLGANPRHSLHEMYKKDLYFVILLFVASTLRERHHRERAIQFFATAILLSAALGPLQFIFTNTLRTFSKSPIGEFLKFGPTTMSLLGLTGERAKGTLSHWLHYAESLLFGLSLWVSALVTSTTRAWWKPLLACWLVVMGILASQSRGPWLAAAILVAMAWTRAPSRRSVGLSLLTLLPMLLILYVPILGDRLNTIGDMNYQSNAERLHMWKVGAVLWQSHPILGIGPGNAKIAALPFETDSERAEGGWGHLHSTYVNFAAERGALGLLAFLGFIGCLALELLRGFRTSNDLEDQRLLFASLLALLGFLLCGLTETAYNTGIIMMTFYFIMGAARAAAESRPT
jgi:O-antigen ligase